MTQEFHISVTPIRDDEFLVRTEEVAPGVPLAEEQLVWPVNDWLEQARRLMNDPLKGLLRGDRVNSIASSTGGDPSEPLLSLVELGQALYRSLFQGRLRDSWMTAQGIAQHRGQALRLRLGLKGDRLPRLPWEVLNSGDYEGFHGVTSPLSTGTDILFSRYQPGTGMVGMMGYAPVAKPQQTLRLLMAIAAPTDQQQLKLNQEAQHLKEELRLRRESLREGMVGNLPDIEVTILEQPGRETLAQALEQGHFQIFHFAGHSDLSDSGGQIYLVNGQTGLSETMSGNDLAGLLANNGVQMAVFNSCRGAYTAASAQKPGQKTNGGDRSLTESLVNRGIPAVLAMAEQIPDDVALSLTRLFYRNLKQDYPVDLSLSRARQGLLSAYSSNQLYWALPILYMHAEFDGYLMAGDRSLENPADSLIAMPELRALPLTGALPAGPATLHSLPSAEEESHSEAAAYSAWTDQAQADGQANPGESSVTAASYMEPQDAPDLGDNPELPEDFFLADDDLEAFNDGLPLDDVANGDEDAVSVRNLVEELEGDSAPPAAAPSTQVNAAPASASPLNGRLPSDSPRSDSPHGSGASSPTAPAAPGAGASSRSNGSDQTPGEEESAAGRPPSGSLSSIVSDAELLNGSAAPPNGTSSAPSSAAKPTTQLVKTPQTLSRKAETGDSKSPGATATLSRSPLRRVGKLITLPLAAVAGAGIVFLGYHMIPEIQQPGSPDAVVGESNLDVEDLPGASTQEVIRFAGDRFNQNDLESGQAAVEELLRRGSLDQALTALETVPTEQINEPLINFLQGRLAWEDLKGEAENFGIQDARQFWSYAAQKSDNPLYHNALGFALYTEGRTEDALEAWQDALDLLEKQGVAVFPSQVVNGMAMGQGAPDAVDVPTGVLNNPDALTAYAGISLAMAQLSAKPSADQPFDLLSKAIQIQQVVLQSDPTGFDPANLRENWLWTEATVREWELLQKLRSQ